MSGGKSPGPDGLTARFYKTFKHAPVLAEVYNEAFGLNCLPPSFSRSHTILLPKSEDPMVLRRVTAYHPICLTNCDYKIFMRILAKRLQPVDKELAGLHQTCGIKGRSIFTNIHTARSIVVCYDFMGTVVAMLQIDLEKAFHKVPHEILLCLLDYVNGGNVIRD